MRVIVVAGLLGLVSVGAPVRAEEVPRPRQGYYLAAGLHGAMLLGFEDGERVGPMLGWQGTLRAGELVTRRFGLGLLIDFGAASGDNQSAGFGELALEAQLELVPNLSAALSVGLGLVSLSSPADDDDANRGATGSSYTVSLRYDAFVSPRRSGGLALTPTLSLRVIPGDTDIVAGFLGVELTWFSGLPKHQLELAPAEAFR
jgi:hypothetical protein